MMEKALKYSAKPNTLFAQTIAVISKKCAIVLSRQAPRSGALFQSYKDVRKSERPRMD